jgi:hypothetical protein
MPDTSMPSGERPRFDVSTAVRGGRRSADADGGDLAGVLALVGFVSVF